MKTETISVKKGTKIMKNRYEFEVFEKGTLYYLATWDCEAETVEEAVGNFSKQLTDPTVIVDEYDIALHIAIFEKLIRRAYEVESCEDYINIILNLTEAEINRYL